MRRRPSRSLRSKRSNLDKINERTTLAAERRRRPGALDPDVAFHDPKPKGSCPGGSKDRFATEHEAGLALVNCKIDRTLHRNTKRQEQRIYACKECWGWHLTSQPPSVNIINKSC